MVPPADGSAGYIAGGAPNAPANAPRSGFAAVFSHPEDRALALIAGPSALTLHIGGEVVFEMAGAGPANPWVPNPATSAAPSLADTLYLVLGSASGTAPGFNLDGIPVALNVDAYSLLGFAASNQPPFQATLGILPASAAATARITLVRDSPAGLVGLVLWHSALAFDLPNGGVCVAASVPRPLLLLP